MLSSYVQVYSNTPADFDFKLERYGWTNVTSEFTSCNQKCRVTNLCFCSLAQGFQSLSDFAGHLAASVDIVFPVIHGQFGEDGDIQVQYSINLIA